MPRIKLCYGMVVGGARWAQEIDVGFGDVSSTAKKCGLCLRVAASLEHFCSRCGNRLPETPSIGVQELVEISLRKSPPPRPLGIIGCGQRICVCQTLAEGDDDFVIWNRPPCPQPGMDLLIRGYVPKAFTNGDIRLFAVHERGLK